MFNKTINNCGVVSGAYGVPSGNSGDFAGVLMRFFLSFLPLLYAYSCTVACWDLGNCKQEAFFKEKKNLDSYNCAGNLFCCYNWHNINLRISLNQIKR